MATARELLEQARNSAKPVNSNFKVSIGNANYDVPKLPGRTEQESFESFISVPENSLTGTEPGVDQEWSSAAKFSPEGDLLNPPTVAVKQPSAREFLESIRARKTSAEKPVDLLSNPEESLSLRDYASGRGSQFLSAMSGAGAGLLESLYDYSPPGQMYRMTGTEYKKPGVAPMREFSADMQGAAEYLKPKHPALKWVTDVVDGTLQMGPSVATAMITKNPNAGLSVMGGQVFGQTYNEAMADGATPDEAALKSIRATAYEIGPEKIFGFFDRLGVTGGVKKYLTQIVAEAGSEWVTEALTINDEVVIQGEEFKGWVDFLKRTGYAASIGAGMGAGMSLGSLQKGPATEQIDEPAPPGFIQDDIPPATPALAEELELDKIAERVLAENPEAEPIDLRQEEQAKIDEAREQKEAEQASKEAEKKAQAALQRLGRKLREDKAAQEKVSNAETQVDEGQQGKIVAPVSPDTVDVNMDETPIPPPSPAQAQEPESALPERTQEILDKSQFVEGVYSYRSAASGLADMAGYREAGVPIGVALPALNKNAETQLVEMALEDHPIFVDSGAFSAFQKNETVDFDDVLDRYDAMIERTGEKSGMLSVVAPDVVGDQQATIDLQNKHADRISAQAEKANVIMPVQKNEAGTLEGIDDHMNAILPDGNYTLGIPSNAAAMSPAELRALLKDWKGAVPKGIHFLGIAANKSKLNQLRRVVLEAWPGDTAPIITSDASRIAAKTDELKENTPKIRREITEEKMANQEIDETDIADPLFFGQGWTPRMITVAANTFGKPVKEMKQIINRADVQEIEELYDSIGDDALMMMFNHAAFEELASQSSGQARSKAIAKTEERKPDLLTQEKSAPAEKPNEPESAPTVDPETQPEQSTPKVTRALKKTNFEAYEQEDGKWYVRTRASNKADWETEIRDELDTTGLKPITAKSDSGRVLVDGEYYQIQEPGMNKGTTEKITKHLLSDLAADGGINPKDFEGELTQTRFGANWVKRKTGKSREELLEWMRENDYLPEDEIDLYAATEKLEQALFDFHDSGTITPRISDVDAFIESQYEERQAADIEQAAYVDELNKEFEGMDDYDSALAEPAHDFYQEAYDEYENEIKSQTEKTAKTDGKKGREGGKKQILPSDETQTELLEGETDADKLHNLKEAKEAKRKGLDKPMVAAEEGPGGLFQKDDTPAPGEADTRNQQELEVDRIGNIYGAGLTVDDVFAQFGKESAFKEAVKSGNNLAVRQYLSGRGFNRVSRNFADSILARNQFGSKNKIFKKPDPIKPGQVNDITQLLVKATQYAGFFVEGGIRDFATFSKEMIASFGDDILPHLRRLFDDAIAAVGAKAKESKSTVEGSPTQSGPTSNKEAQVDRERAAKGKQPVGKPELPNLEEMNEAALAELNADVTLGSTIIDEILTDPEPKISDKQNALMSMYRRKTMNERDKWAKKAESGNVDAKRKYDEYEAELERIDRAAAITRSQWGRWGRIQQEMIAQDYSIEAMERKARVAAQGPLNQSQIKEIKEQSEQIAAEQKALVEAEEKQESNVVEMEFSAMYKQLEKEGIKALQKGNARRLKASGKAKVDHGLSVFRKRLGTAPGNPMFDPELYKAMMEITVGIIEQGAGSFGEVLVKMRGMFSEEENALFTDDDLHSVYKDTVLAARKQVQKQAKKKTKESKKKTDSKTPKQVKEQARKKKQTKEQKPSEILPTTAEEVIIEVEALQDPDSEIDPRLIAKLALAFILDGVHGENAVMAAVTEALQEFYPNITEHEVRLAFTQYGKISTPSQEEANIELREIKTLVRLQESIDRLKAGLDPLKTGLQRDKATQKIRERQKVLNILMREHAKKNPQMTAEKLASVEATRLTRLRNRLADLEKQRDTGERPGKKVKVDDSAEVEKLKKQIEIVKKEIKLIDEAKNPPISPEEKQLNELAELRDHLDKVLQNREAAKQQKPFKPLSKKAADFKKEIDELRKAVAVMRRKLKDPRSPAQKREAAQIKALEEAIDLYDRKLAAGDFSALHEKKDIPVTDRVKALRQVRDARRKVYNAAKKASKPILSREERVNRQRMAALKRREAELKSRMKVNDFRAKPKRKAVEDSKEVAKRRYELDKQIAKFNERLADYRYQQMGWFKKGAVNFGKLLNLSRAIITSVDLSAVLRQGGIAILAHPKLLKKGFMPMLRAFRSREGAHKIDTEIKGRKNANLYKESGLFIAEQNTTDLSKMEEVYMSKWAESIPVIAGSSRAYVTFLNKLRADMFDMMLDTLTADGHTHTKAEIEAISNYVNVATGRGLIGGKGSMGLKERSQAGNNLAVVFFAPKYVASRFNYLLGQPLYTESARKAPAVQKMIAKEYVRYFSGVSAIVGLAVMAAAAFRDDDDEREIISFDPRSSDFLKVRFGDTRIDLMSGLIQPTVFLTRTLSGQTKTGRGDVKALRNWWQFPTDDLDPYAGVTYGARETFGVMTTFGRSKLAPAPGALINFLSGTNVVGQQVHPGAEIGGMFAPLSLRDFAGMVEGNGVPGAIALQTIVTFGAGAQTYGDGGWSEQQGAIDRKIQEIKDQVTAEETPKARREKFNELKAEYPWLLSGAGLERYKSIESAKSFLKRKKDDPEAKMNTPFTIKETKDGVKIKDFPEHIKSDKIEVIGDIGSAIRKLQKKGKIADFADLAEYSPALQKALDSGAVDYSQFLGMKIGKELEESARLMKKENLANIRRAKRAAKN